MAKRLFREGSALYVQGDYQKALEAFQKARTARPLAAFDFNIARCYDRLGHWADALAEYERFVASATDPADIREAQVRIPVLRERVKVAANRAAADEHYKRAIGHYNAGEHAKAIGEFKLAHQTLPDPLFLYNIAQAYRLAQDAENAIAYYRSFLNAAPQTALRKSVEERIAELRPKPAGATPAPHLLPPRPVAQTTKSPPPSDPKSGAAAPSERLKPVQDLIKANRAGFRGCFDVWSAQHPGIAGKVTLSFYLDPDGVLNQAEAETKGFESQDVAVCIVDRAKALTYPAAPNGKYTRYSYPFDFKPN